MDKTALTLRAEYGELHWSVYSDGSTRWKDIPLAAVPGFLSVDHFRGYEISEVTPEHITLRCGEREQILRPGETVILTRSVDGREWSDRCVYDGNTYLLKITWL